MEYQIKTTMALHQGAIMLNQVYEILSSDLYGSNQKKAADEVAKDAVAVLEMPSATTHVATTLIDHQERLFDYKRAAHDLINPLATQFTLIDMLKDQASKTLQHVEASSTSEAGVLKEELSSILEYIDFLSIANSESLKISRSAFNDNQQRNELISFTQLVNDIIQLLGIRELHKDIEVIIQHNTTKDFYTDATILQSIVQNLIQNAVKYKKQDEANILTITINEVDKGVEIIIQDTGIGMHEQRLQQLFSNVVSSDTTVKDSHGFGLYAVAQQVQKLEGTITASSSLGVGSSFTVWLPTLINVGN